MKLLTFLQAGDHRIGAMTERGVVDLSSLVYAQPASLVDLLAGGESLLATARRLVADATVFIDAAAVQLLAPIPRPGKFLGVGGNFASHILEASHLGATTPPYPVFFNKQTTCVSGPHDPILKPHDSEQLDYEGELGLVIGRRCRRVRVADALAVVAGYVVCNDVSIRDWQMRSSTATLGKSFDSHGPFGPYLVTPDEAGPPGDKRIRTWVNGALRQDGSTAEMIFGCAELIADLSQKCTLEVGDVVSVGSPAGVGGLMKPPVFLRAGDIVRVEIDGIGAIENRVVDEAETAP